MIDSPPRLPRRLLCLCDSPTAPTGFGRVARELLARWQPHFDSISVWGINYHGEPHPLQHRYELWPASSGNSNWYDVSRLNHFLKLLQTQQNGVPHFTHVWILQDSWNLSRHGFPEKLTEACQANEIGRAHV